MAIIRNIEKIVGHHVGGKGCLPARELEHANPLRLRVVSATEHGQYPTHDPKFTCNNDNPIPSKINEGRREKKRLMQMPKLGGINEKNRKLVLIVRKRLQVYCGSLQPNPLSIYSQSPMRQCPTFNSLLTF